jgi:hypothetical protein
MSYDMMKVQLIINVCIKKSNEITLQTFIIVKIVNQAATQNSVFRNHAAFSSGTFK